MSARFYSPGIGAFTSLDSVMGSAQNPLSMNRFLYALANPATMIDPTGHLAGVDDRFVGHRRQEFVAGATVVGGTRGGSGRR